MNKVLGSSLIVAGTAIGAGMLALPIASAGAGYVWAMFLLTVMWGLSYVMALIILEVTLCFKEHISFSTMTLKTLGRKGQWLMNTSLMLLLYTLSTAYISGGASLLNNVLQATSLSLPITMQKLLFTVTLGSFLLISTTAVDYANRFLFISKIMIFLVIVAALTPAIQPHYFTVKLAHTKYLFAAIPVYFASYGYHVIIPAISQYCNNQPKLVKKVLFIGSSLPFLVYALWLTISFGLLPKVGLISFSSVLAAGDAASAGNLIAALSKLSEQQWIAVGINAFSDLAITTSFLGVALGLFDLLVDALKISASKKGRAAGVAVTLLPPLLAAIFYPEFTKLLGLAGVFFLISGLILPALMLLKTRKSQQFTSQYHVPYGRVLAISVFIFGIFIIVIQGLNFFNRLPVLL